MPQDGDPALRSNNPAPPSAVLDTNVVLDWLVFRDPAVQALAAALEEGRLRWLACARMRDELAVVLVRPQLERWRPDPAQTLSAFDRLAVACAAPPPSLLVCRDGDDQVFVDLALAHRSRWLLTHDRALLALARQARPHGTTIISPRSWSALARHADAGA